MSSKKKLLEERARQLEKVLTNYARSLKLIGLEKCIQITLSFAPSLSRSAGVRTTKLTQEDWHIIQSLPWNEIESTLLGALLQSKNRPVTVVMGMCNFGLVRDGINQRFTNDGLTYRLRGTRYKRSGESSQDVPFQLTKG